MSSLLRLALLTVALVFTTTASYAQGMSCKPMQQATGSASLGAAAAKASAVSNWRRAVILKYGESHSDYAKAKDQGENCGKTMLGLTRCEVRGAPCETAQAGGNGGIEVGGDENCGDSERCVRVVKWVQRKLKDRGYYEKDVDGIPGDGTARAIRRYKKDKNLGGAPDEIDEALITSLRG